MVGVTVSFDSSEFKTKFGLWMSDKLLAAREGVGEACEELVKDTVEEIPTAPIKNSYLRGSNSVFVDGVIRPNMLDFKYGIPLYKATSSPTSKGTWRVIGEVVFNAPYTAKWHEHWPPTGGFSNPTSGIKFLEKKIVEFNRKYFSIIAHRMMRGG